MMTSPTLEPHRAEIAERLRRGESKADIKRTLEYAYGVSIGRSQFYAFVDQVTAQPLNDREEAPIMQREIKTPDSILADDSIRAFFVELPRALQEMSERLTALEQKAGEHQNMTLRALREFHETLTGVAKAASALPPVTARSAAPPPVPIHAVTLRRIWKRAFVVSGVVWGLVELLLVRGYWRSVWALAVK